MNGVTRNGFTLLEVLITLVVVSLGLLGLLGLQAVSLANTQVSHARSIATEEADNIAERMRANPAGINNNDYADISNPSGGGASAPSPDCSTTTCNVAEMADYDTYLWDQRIGQTLPGGQGRITCLDSVPSPADADDCSDGSPHLITIIWSELDRVADRGGAADKCAALDDVDSRCFQTTFLP